MQANIARLDSGALGGFDQLLFRVEFGDQTVVERRFDDEAEAIAFFDDRLIRFDPSQFLPDFGFFSGVLGVSLETITDELGGGVSLDLAVATVPEPGTALLLVLGLAALVRRRGRL